MSISNLWVNPLTNPLVEPVTLMLAILFAGAGLVLQTQKLVVRPININRNYNHSQPDLNKVLWQRYRTWAIIAPIFAEAALCGPLAVALLVAFIIWQGSREFALLTGLSRFDLWVMVGTGWLTLVAVLLWGAPVLTTAPVIAFLGRSLLALQARPGETSLNQRFTVVVTGLWGYLYIGWLPIHLLALSKSPLPSLVLAVGLGVAMSDVGAFVAGKAIGGPKLAPRLSPTKTWGGVVGNLGGAAVAVTLISFTLPSSWQGWQWLTLILTIGLGSIWGDLLESLLKRQSGVKDAGNLLPGFGGLLDRVDSLLLVAPLVYYLATLVLI